MALAFLPMILGGHQIIEAFVWWGIEGRAPADVGGWAAWFYLLVAFGLLPWFVPWVVRRIEPIADRRTLTALLVGVGAIVSAYLMVGVLRGPITLHDGGYYASYSVGLTFAMVAAVFYVVATCGSLAGVV